ncbi:MAG: hypothetical protein QXP34_03315, partial [Candidatus Aenigmatarchaeota archaeon]
SDIDFSSIAEQILDIVKNLQIRISNIEKKSNKFLENKVFYDTITEIKKKLDNLEDKIFEISKIADKDFLENVRNLNNLKTKIEILETEYKNLIKDSDFLEIKSELLKLEKRLKKLEEYAKIDEILTEINNIKSVINQISSDLELIKLNYIDKDKYNEYFEKMKDVEKAISRISFELKQKITDIIKINDRLDKIENEFLPNIQASLERSLNELKTDIGKIKEKIQNSKILEMISEEDIKNIRELNSYKEAYKKILNLENRLNNIVSSLYSLEDEMRNSFREEYDKKVERIKAIENRIDTNEKLINNFRSSIDGLRKEITDLRDIMLYLTKENDKTNEKIKELENKIKLANIEELYDYIERLKLLEAEIENLKRELINRDNFDRERIKNIEYALKKLYDRQNEILENLKRRI